MSRRLQVVLSHQELDEIRRAASRHQLTVSEWVRQSLREARKNEPSTSKEVKLTALRKACAHGFPTADIDQMLAEIEQGYGTTS